MIDQEICVPSVEKELKILFDTKKCYLFTNLVEEIYEIYCVEEEVDDNKKIKYFLLTNFQDNSLNSIYTSSLNTRKLNNCLLRRS